MKECGLVICSKQDSGEIFNEFKLGTNNLLFIILSFYLTKIVPSLYNNQVFYVMNNVNI